MEGQYIRGKTTPNRFIQRQKFVDLLYQLFGHTNAFIGLVIFIQGQRWNFSLPFSWFDALAAENETMTFGNLLVILTIVSSVTLAIYVSVIPHSTASIDTWNAIAFTGRCTVKSRQLDQQARLKTFSNGFSEVVILQTLVTSSVVVQKKTLQ